MKPSDLTLDERCQARISLTEEALESYTAAYKVGESLPPIEVFEADGKMIVVDGFHRVEAAKRAKVATLPVKVVGKGSLDDAVWVALTKNQSHGVRRTNADKRKAVRLALATDKGAAMSDRKLAKHLGVSHTYVAKVRGDKVADAQLSQTVKLGHAFLASTAGADLAARVRVHDQQCRAIDYDLQSSPHVLNQKAHLYLIWSRFEKARQKMEAQGGYFWAGVDPFYIATMVLEAAGFPEHRAKLDKEAKGPVGFAIRIPDRYADDIAEEIQQLAPWRKVERVKVKDAVWRQTVEAAQ